MLIIIILQIVWEPYLDFYESLPHICLDGSHVWRAVVPLIFFHIVEWHQPDRVIRQFGLQQAIPDPPRQPEQLHDLTLRGKQSDNWTHLYASVIQIWNERAQYVVISDHQLRLLSENDPYMRWYSRHTRRWISRDGACRGQIVSIITFC